MPALKKEIYLKILEKLILVRRIEEKIQQIYHTDLIKSPVHLSLGQELLASVISNFIEIDDKVIATYRGHALALCLSNDVQPIINELCAKKTGIFGGRNGSMHLGSDNQIMPWTSAIVSTGIPISLGLAEAAKRLNLEDNKKRLVLCQFGDGAMEEGVFIESINYASLKNLPIVFSCEDNNLAIFTHKSRRTPPSDYCKRVESWNMKSIRNTYLNPLELVDTVQAAFNFARNVGPIFMLTECFRWTEHVGVGYDWNLGYRKESDFIKWQNADVENNPSSFNLKESDITQINTEVEAFVDELFNKAQLEKDSDSNDLMRNIY